jgi:hypothetical protein
MIIWYHFALRIYNRFRLPDAQVASDNVAEPDGEKVDKPESEQ